MKFEFSPYIAFQVKEFEKAADFYENVLGMEVTKKDEEEIFLKSGPVTFCIEDSPGGFTFFEFKVDNISEAKELLERNGCRVTQVYNEKSMMIADPYGMRFHLWEDGETGR